MTVQAESVTAVTTLVFFLLLWVLFFWFYRDYRIDVFRQQMFATRDRLFDWAADEGISFDHPAYGLIRTTMNGFIRFGDRLSFLSLLVGLWSHPRRPASRESFHGQLEAALASLDGQQQARMRAFVAEMNARVIEHIVFTSPILILTLVPIAWAVWMKTASSRVIRRLAGRIKWLRKGLAELDAVAFHAGRMPQAV